MEEVDEVRPVMALGQNPVEEGPVGDRVVPPRGPAPSPSSGEVEVKLKAPASSAGLEKGEALLGEGRPVSARLTNTPCAIIVLPLLIV